MQIEWRHCVKLKDNMTINMIVREDQLQCTVQKCGVDIYKSTLSVEHIFESFNSGLSRSVNLTYINLLNTLGIKKYGVIKKYWIFKPITLKANIEVVISQTNNYYEMYISKDGFQEYEKCKDSSEVNRVLVGLVKGLETWSL